MTEPLAPIIARAICKSGKFETGQGTCALLCMDQLGSPRTGHHGCHHAARIHGDLAAQIARALASGIEARSDETAQQAQPKARARPDAQYFSRGKPMKTNTSIDGQGLGALIAALQPFKNEWDDMGPIHHLADDRLMLDVDPGGEILTVGHWRALMSALAKAEGQP